MKKSEILRKTLKSLRNYCEFQFSDLLKEMAIESEEDIMLVQEVVWDLITERVLTPGSNSEQLAWPWLRVTDRGKLERKIRDIS